MCTYQLCLHQMHSVSADIIMLLETNLLWKDYQVYKATTNHRRNIFTHSCQNGSYSKKPFHTPYQPVGTCSILTNKMVGHYHSSSTDSSLGRWNITSTLPVVEFYQSSAAIKPVMLLLLLLDPRRSTCNNGLFSANKASLNRTLDNNFIKSRLYSHVYPIRQPLRTYSRRFQPNTWF